MRVAPKNEINNLDFALAPSSWYLMLCILAYSFTADLYYIPVSVAMLGGGVMLPPNALALNPAGACAWGLDPSVVAIG